MRVFVQSLVIALIGAIPALGQVAPTEPNQAARTRPTTDMRISTSFYGAYGEPQFAAVTPGGTGNVVEAGADGVFSAVRQGRRNSFTLTGASLTRRFWQEGQRSLSSHAVSTQLTTAISTRTTLSLDGSGSYSHFGSLAAYPRTTNEPIAGGPLQNADFALAVSPTVNYSGRLQLTRQFSTRTSMVVSAAGTLWKPLHAGANDVHEYRGTVGLISQIRQRVAVNVEYGYRQAEYQNPTYLVPIMRQHVGTLGISREWAHSPTRHSILRVAFGPSLVLRQGRYDYLATGQVSFDSQVSRRLTLGGGGSRDTTVLDGTLRRVVAGSAFAQAQWQLTDAFTLALNARVSDGSAPFDAVAGSYRAQGGSARLSWRVARSLAAYGEYIHTYYALSGSLRDSGLWPRREQRSGRIGLTWLLPLTGRSTGNAAQ